MIVVHPMPVAVEVITMVIEMRTQTFVQSLLTTALLVSVIITLVVDVHEFQDTQTLILRITVQLLGVQVLIMLGK